MPMVLHDKGDPLTAREMEVLQLIARGETTKEIGRLLGISHRTAEVHRLSIRTKLGARTAGEVVAIAFQAGLLSNQP